MRFPAWPSDVAKPSPPPPAPPASGYQPITFDESPGVPPQGGTGTVRPGSGFKFPSFPYEGVHPQIVLGLPFFLHVHNILDDAEVQMRAGEACSLDHVAELIAAKVRENLIVVYERSAEGR